MIWKAVLLPGHQCPLTSFLATTELLLPVCTTILPKVKIDIKGVCCDAFCTTCSSKLTLVTTYKSTKLNIRNVQREHSCSFFFPEFIVFRQASQMTHKQDTHLNGGIEVQLMLQHRCQRVYYIPNIQCLVRLAKLVDGNWLHGLSLLSQLIKQS
jgi:hypothetical protein